MKLLIILAGIALLLFTTSASAGSMRCSTHVIKDGAENPPSMDEVIKKCGKPDKRTYGELIYKKHKKRLVFDTNGKLRTIHEASEPPDS